MLMGELLHFFPFHWIATILKCFLTWIWLWSIWTVLTITFGSQSTWLSLFVFQTVVLTECRKLVHRPNENLWATYFLYFANEESKEQIGIILKTKQISKGLAGAQPIPGTQDSVPFFSASHHLLSYCCVS